MPGHGSGMVGLGRRLKERARELGWSDAEVARRLGIAQTRYANYVTDRHEPDLGTLLRICRILGMDVGTLLGEGPPGAAGGTPELLRERIAAASRAMDDDTLRVAVEVMDALAARPRPATPSETSVERTSKTAAT